MSATKFHSPASVKVISLALFVLRELNMAKKKKYKPRKTDEAEIEAFREHIKLINEKTKTIVEKYRQWWDKDKKTWKKGFKGHGNS